MFSTNKNYREKEIQNGSVLEVLLATKMGSITQKKLLSNKKGEKLSIHKLEMVKI